MPGPHTPEQPVNTGFTIEERMQTMKNLASNFKVTIPGRFKEDPHFWYLTMRDYWTQRKRIPEALEIKLETKLDRETNLGNVRKLAITNAVEHASKYALLEKEAATDNLTGAFNQRALDRYLTNLLGQRSQDEVDTLVMIDIDGFKGVNDRYGHPAANVALKEMIKLIQSQIRGIDFLARYAGDEFFLVIPGTSTKQENWQEKLMERVDSIRQSIAGNLRAKVEEITGKKIEEQITTSMGIVFARDDIMVLDGRGLDNVYKLVDKKLYEAKDAGRNRVVGPDGPFKPQIKEEEKPPPKYTAGVFEISKAGNGGQANSALLEILGYEKLGNVGQINLDEAFYLKIAEALKSKGGKITRVESELIRQNGTKIPVMITAIPVVKPGHEGNFLCIVQELIEGKDKALVPKPGAEISCCSNCAGIRLGDQFIPTAINVRTELYEVLTGITQTDGICLSCSRVLYPELHDEPDK